MASPSAATGTESSSAHSVLLSRMRPHGLPCLNVLSSASRIEGSILPFSMAADLRPMMSSIGLTPLGHRSVQFEHVVQFQASGRPLASFGPVPVIPS